MRYGIPMTRRNFIRTSTTVAGTILLGGPIKRSGPAPAGAQTSAPPTVDRLAVRVVVDSYQDALVRTAKVGSVEVQRFGVVFGPGLGRHIHSIWSPSVGARHVRLSWTSASPRRRCSTTSIS